MRWKSRPIHKISTSPIQSIVVASNKSPVRPAPPKICPLRPGLEIRSKFVHFDRTALSKSPAHYASPHHNYAKGAEAFSMFGEFLNLGTAKEPFYSKVCTTSSAQQTHKEHRSPNEPHPLTWTVAVAIVVCVIPNGYTMLVMKIVVSNCSKWTTCWCPLSWVLIPKPTSESYIFASSSFHRIKF